jgi:hypothetical protein
MDGGKGKSLDFMLSQALAYPVVKKGSLRSSRKCVNPLPDKLASVLVSPVYPVRRREKGGHDLGGAAA